MREREDFRRATMEPVQQLRDELRLRLYEGLQQPPSEHLGHLEAVKMQVFVSKIKKTAFKCLQVFPFPHELNLP